MAAEETCERHAWASVGVVARDGGVQRIWECEHCPVWTAEQFDAAHEQPWDETWLAER
ncbi:hypothetical protein [Halobacterium yunchengense]|uniref:hypothetical protein n=1 Tax=Halobacterium yunchengense TaxID=3108497 RepID=UPI003008CDC9